MKDVYNGERRVSGAAGSGREKGFGCTYLSRLSKNLKTGTVDTYRHLIPSMDEAAVDRLDAATRRNPGATAVVGDALRGQRRACITICRSREITTLPWIN
jgi:hypothetical protein